MVAPLSAQAPSGATRLFHRPTLMTWNRVPQPIIRMLWSPVVHYRVHSNPTYAFILSQMNPIHAILLSYLQIRFNIILLSYKSSKWGPFFGGFPQNPRMHVSCPHVPRHAPPIFLCLI